MTFFSKEFLLKNSKKYFGDFVLLSSKYILQDKLCKNLKSVLETNKAKVVSNKGDWIKTMVADQDYATSFSKGLDQRGLYLAKKLVEKINLSNIKYLVDIGGGFGIYSLVFASYYNHLKIDILELSVLTKSIEQNIDKNNFNKQIKVVSGDMFNFNYEKKYDAHFYANVLHDWDKESVIKLLQKSYNELPKNGKIIVFDGHLKEGDNPWSLLENNISLLLTTKGRYYYSYELKNILKKIGFLEIKEIDVISGRTLIIAEK